MKIYEAWGDPTIGANFFCSSPITDEEKLNHQKTVNLNVRLAQEDGEQFIQLFSIVASGWLDAMTEYYRVQNWGEDKPEAWALEQIKYMEDEQ